MTTRRSIQRPMISKLAIAAAATVATAAPWPGPGIAGQTVGAARWAFDSDHPGGWPQGFVFGRTGGGPPGRWVVRSASDAPSAPNVLAQEDSDRTDYRFPVAVASAPALRDVAVAVRCKPLTGRVDRACGIVFRYRDQDNYYVTRANALEDNVRLYYVKDGRRRQIGGWNGPVAAGVWHQLRAEARGDSISVSWDGNEVIEARDATFPSAGQVGVWTKADSFTLFDDLTVTPLRSLPAASLGQAPLGAPWDSVGRILRTSGTASGGYYRYGWPRRDLTVRIGDVTVSPALALGAWAGFAGDPADATMMGDLVLTSDELKPVLAELGRQRIAVTAVHNHLVGETPQITYVHFHADGDALDLAARLDRVLARTATPRPVATAPPQPLTIDTALVFNRLGLSGRALGVVAQVSTVLVPGPVTLHGRPVTPALGYATPINIQVVGAGRAVATGDFAVLGPKVTPVLDALTANGITATAVHSHLVGEQPTIYYMHFWADGPLADVLRGLRAGLDAAR